MKTENNTDIEDSRDRIIASALRWMDQRDGTLAQREGARRNFELRVEAELQYTRSVAMDSDEETGPAQQAAKSTPVLSIETGRNFDIDLKNAHTLADFVNNASPECSPIDALHKCIDRLAEYAEDKRPDAPAQVGGGRFGKGIKWSVVIAAAERHHAYMNTPEREAERIKRAGELVKRIQVGAQPAPTKPAKLTGRDLYTFHAFNQHPKPMPAWCELADDEQDVWNEKAREQS